VLRGPIREENGVKSRVIVDAPLPTVGVDASLVVDDDSSALGDEVGVEVCFSILYLSSANAVRNEGF